SGWRSRSSKKSHHALFIQLFTVAAQLFEIDDRHAAILKSQQALFLKRLKTSIGILPGDTGQRSQFFLGNLQMTSPVRIENGIEQRCDAASEASRRIQHTTVF